MTQFDEAATRRRFLGFVAAGAMALTSAGSLLRSRSAMAAAGQLDEADPTAASLGYKKDTTQVDAAKYPQHAPTQDCAGCRYFQGKGTSEWARCTIFPGKGSVHSKGWCAAYAAK